MLDRHAVRELLRAGVKPLAVAAQFGVSRRTVERIARDAREAGENSEPQAEKAQAGWSGLGVGRPRVSEAVLERVRGWLLEEPELPPGEVWRRLKEDAKDRGDKDRGDKDRGDKDRGDDDTSRASLGLSTTYRVIASVRRTIPVELMVRFEGVAGEFAQFDFGQVDVRLTSGVRRRIHFAAYRLKYARWMHVVVVESERVEPLVRSLLAGFESAGGVPLRVVFDNPKTVVTGRHEGRPVWNPTLAEVAIDYGFTIELCTPRSPEQKGAVENLVGFVKRTFFRARRFQDLETDLVRQLAEWLIEVNEVRPCRATGEPPVLRLAAERARMKPLATPAAEYGLKVPVTVGPTAMVSYQGVRYAMPAQACGIPATLWLYPARVRIITAGARHEAVHPRFPLVGTTSYLTGQRAQQLAAVFGARKRLYFMRERILELGPVGESYLTELVHQRTHTWKGDVERLFALLERLGEDRFRQALQRALFQRLIGAEYVEQIAAQLPAQSPAVSEEAS